MRKELELMETIEKYINGTLNETDRQSFEAKLKTDESLQEELKLQRSLLGGIERAGIKQAIQKAYDKIRFKRFMRWGLGGLGLIVIAACLFFSFQDKESKTRESAHITANEVKVRSSVASPSYDSSGIVKQGMPVAEAKTPVTTHRGKAPSRTFSANIPDPSINNPAKDSASTPQPEKSPLTKEPELNFKIFTTASLPVQKFSVSGNRDTVLTTKQGVMIQILKNSFVSSSGKNVSGKIEIRYREALDPATIALANLVTTTKGKTLESGGMIELIALAGDEQLFLSEGSNVNIAVPTANKKNDMMIFQGKVQENKIDWINPVAMRGDQIFAVDQVDDQREGRKRIFGKNREDGVISQTTGVNTNIFSPNPLSSYVFKVTNMGWANIDRLASYSQAVELVVNIPNNKEYMSVQTSILFPAKNVFLAGYQKGDGSYGYTHGDYEKTRLPIGEKAILLAYGFKDNKPYFCSKEITISASQSIDLTLTEKGEKEIENSIREQVATIKVSKPVKK